MMDKTQIAVSVFDKYADMYQNKFMNVDLYGDALDVFCDNLSATQSNILELACGPGNITKYILNKRPGLQLLGTDLSPNMIALARKNNPTAKFQILDSRQLLSLEQKFDGVICGFLFPYLSKDEVLQLIIDISLVLNKQGLIYISTMEDDYHKSGFEKGSAGDEIFMHYHEEKYLRVCLEKNNFELISLHRKQYTPEGKAPVTDLIMIAKKLNR